ENVGGIGENAGSSGGEATTKRAGGLVKIRSGYGEIVSVVLPTAPLLGGRAGAHHRGFTIFFGSYLVVGVGGWGAVSVALVEIMADICIAMLVDKGDYRLNGRSSAA
ncbi:hypothetical protein CG471_24370, partial [Sphingobium sp. IP1]|uniref:hypothetical protein n=1 Tax=Sphingobium sp. IP1 TaxID=2021637 RepID=UPI000C08EA20